MEKARAITLLSWLQIQIENEANKRKDGMKNRDGMQYGNDLQLTVPADMADDIKDAVETTITDLTKAEGK